MQDSQHKLNNSRQKNETNAEKFRNSFHFSLTTCFFFIGKSAHVVLLLFYFQCVFFFFLCCVLVCCLQFSLPAILHFILLFAYRTIKWTERTTIQPLFFGRLRKGGYLHTCAIGSHIVEYYAMYVVQANVRVYSTFRFS